MPRKKIKVMPYCSSILWCDCPISYNTYRGGCAHFCIYCSEAQHGRFAPREYESWKGLEAFIKGKRNWSTRWVDSDWKIPIHWGTLSDPFPVVSSRLDDRACNTLITLAEHNYPVIITTKSTLCYTEYDYISLLCQSNVVLQVSMVSKSFVLEYEPNAPSFRDRYAMLYGLSRNVKRLIVRCQPFVVEELDNVLGMIPAYKASGVYGVLVGAMTSHVRKSNMNVRVGDGWCYDYGVLYNSLTMIKQCCHDYGLVFLTNEMDYATMSDSPTCCGCEGLDGFDVNTSNFNHLPIVFREKMTQPGTASTFRRDLRNNSLDSYSYAEVALSLLEKKGLSSVV